MIRIRLLESDDPERDLAKFQRLLHVCESYPGDSAVVIDVYSYKISAVTQLLLPGVTVDAVAVLDEWT